MDIPVTAEPDDPTVQARTDRRRFWRAALLSAGFVALLWWIKMVEVMLGQDLHGLTLRPGDWSGLIGVLTAPLLHGSLKHLAANSLPLLILGTLLFATLPRAALRSVVLIWLFSGIGVWLIGRPSGHLGASGLTHGLMLLLFVAGIIRRDRPAIAAACIAFFMYGGMLLTVLPREAGISWEYHLTGAIGGVLAALLWSRLDPTPPRKRYSWEDEEESMEPVDDVLEPPPPNDVPVLWHRPDPERGVVLQFRPRRDDQM